MRRLGLIAGLWACVLVVGRMGALGAGQDPAPGDAPVVIASAEAHEHVGEECTVEMTVRASKNAEKRRTYYLDSEEDFRDAKNLAVLIDYEHAGAFKEAGIADPAAHYRGKVIRVRGKIIAESDQVRIRVTDPKQIELVEPK